MKRKIGILTQPLYCNYGGILQCYALQTILNRMGHDTIVLQREFNRKYTFKGGCIYYFKHIIKLMIGQRSSWHYYVNPKRLTYIAQNTYKFINNNINPRSNYCYTTKELREEVIKHNLDAIIVGSDQVWRHNYSPCLSNYFLDFLEDNHKIRKISYAASFGINKWTFSDKQTHIFGNLLKLFNSVSVREISAVKLCKEHFDINAVLVLDPTMLLNPIDYQKIILPNKNNRGDLFCYILDRSHQKREIINYIANQNKLKPFESMPLLLNSVYNLYEDIDKCVYPSVEDWLSAFMEADYVLTDSFHGTVFSIIFNKPFWIVGNKERGMARFESLLSLFNLENRFITITDLNNINFMEPILWDTINKKMIELRKDSIQFIINALK